MLNPQSILKSEAQIKIARAFGYFWNSLDIPGHSLHAPGNLNELIRTIKYEYSAALERKIEKLEEIAELYEQDGELLLTDQVISFITSHVGRKPYPKKALVSRPYDSELEVTRYYTSYGKY